MCYAFDVVHKSHWCVYTWFAWIHGLQAMSRPSLGNDRKDFLDGMALKAHVAMCNGDHKTSYSVAGSLGAAKSSLNTELFKLDGTLTQSSQEVIERWDEHFADVFMGSLQSLNNFKKNRAPSTWFALQSRLWPRGHCGLFCPVRAG